MAKYNSSGWFKQSGRHSNARRTGRAGGTYSTKRDKLGYVTEFNNPKAKNKETVYIAQTAKYDGFTAEIDNPKNRDEPKYLGHSMNAEKLGEKYAKKYKKVKYLD